MTIPKRPTVLEIALLESLFDHSPDIAFFVKDREGNYVSVNQSVLERHGLKSKREAIGKKINDICPGELGRQAVEQDERVLRTGKPLVEHLELHWARPHRPVWCLTTKVPIWDPAGKVIGLVGYSRDLRLPLDAAEIPQQFAEALADFEQTLANDVTPAWLAEKSGVSHQRLTRLVKRLFGLTPGQLITKTRIAAGSRLLLDSKLSVAEVAQACGYYDQSAFTRAFRSATGFTPTEFVMANR
jgi:PAS domain S-box-containing protein